VKGHDPHDGQWMHQEMVDSMATGLTSIENLLFGVDLRFERNGNEQSHGTRQMDAIVETESRHSTRRTT